MLMTKKQKTKLSKKGWISSFNLVGRAKINDYTYKFDEKSEKSDWVYNTINLGVDCGNNGTVYCEMMGGYGSERDNVIYVHGRKEDGQDDFENRFEIDWDDRNDESILEDVGDLCFITIGLEKDKNDKTYAKKFLSAYDAINYINEHLEDGTIVNVKGNLQYSKYQGNIQVKKIINSIFLSKVEDVDKFKSTFTQTMLLKKDSVGEPNKEKGSIPIYATVIDYTKFWGDKEVKTFVPFNKIFEYECDLDNKELTKKIIAKLFKVKKNCTEITFEGELIEGGAIITATEDDLTEDIKELIELGIMTKEEALTKCVEGTSREKRMLLRKPLIKMVGDEGEKIAVVQKFEDKCKEEDLILDFMLNDNENDDDEEVDDCSEDVSDDDLSFLDDLD